jgi:hypothetical protein
MVRLAASVGKLGASSGGLEELASKIVDTVYNALSLPDGAPSLGLLRFFHTLPFRSLPPNVQQKLVGSEKKIQLHPETNCMVLLATRGQLPAWNSREGSINHQAIPLASAEFVKNSPMISQMTMDLGIPFDRIVQPLPTSFMQPASRTYQTFYVEDAHRSQWITAKESFVEPYGIRSVIGIGGLLSSGAFFVLIGFFKRTVSGAEAKNFTLIAPQIESALNAVSSFERRIPKILVADVPEGSARIAECLGLRHDLVITHKLSEALDLVNKIDFDLILSGAHFDDSQMFELLAAVRKSPTLHIKPFVCFRQLESSLFEETKEGIVMAANHMDACFLDGKQLSDTELRAAIESYIPKNIWMEPRIAQTS